MGKTKFILSNIHYTKTLIHFAYKNHLSKNRHTHTKKNDESESYSEFRMA